MPGKRLSFKIFLSGVEGHGIYNFLYYNPHRKNQVQMPKFPYINLNPAIKYFQIGDLKVTLQLWYAAPYTRDQTKLKKYVDKALAGVFYCNKNDKRTLDEVIKMIDTFRMITGDALDINISNRKKIILGIPLFLVVDTAMINTKGRMKISSGDLHVLLNKYKTLSIFEINTLSGENMEHFYEWLIRTIYYLIYDIKYYVI